MSIALSSDDRSVIERQIVDNNVTTDIDVDKIVDVFEVERCVEWIRENDLQNVTLQFPDELLSFSAKVALQIECQIGHR